MCVCAFHPLGFVTLENLTKTAEFLVVYWE